MPKPADSHVLRGFQNGEFRRALYSFLKEKCAEQVRGDDVPFDSALKIIRNFIQKKQPVVPEAEPLPV